MNVLSLFDGISCGQVALERAGIKVDTYYASEIEPNPIKVTMKNYPNTIQLGDVTKWREWNIDWSSIDLLLGGSPCQGFSFAGRQLNFEDPRSELFFEYADILNNIKEYNPDIKFLLENVKMKQEYQDVITEYLWVEPKIINSDRFVCQNRPRTYWCNWEIDWVPERPNWNTQYYQYRRTYWRELKNGTCCCLTANMGTGGNNVPYRFKNGEKTKLAPVDCEMLQGLPFGYTSGVANTHRYKAIGNGWTVDVVAHIFSFLPNEFKKEVNK